MNEINLSDLELKTFTEQDVLDYCQINNINPLYIIELNLNWNKLTDISGIKLFKNLKELYLSHNELKDISVLKLFKNLKILTLIENKIEDILVLKYLNNLKELNIGNNKVKDIQIVKYLKKLIYLGIINLGLESDQYKYINSLKNLNVLYHYKEFKNKNILNQLNKNIKLL